MDGRTSKQCRERWCHHLDPAVRKGGYTTEEDDLIILLQVSIYWGAGYDRNILHNMTSLHYCKWAPIGGAGMYSAAREVWRGGSGKAIGKGVSEDI